MHGPCIEEGSRLAVYWMYIPDMIVQSWTKFHALAVPHSMYHCLAFLMLHASGRH